MMKLPLWVYMGERRWEELGVGEDTGTEKVVICLGPVFSIGWARLFRERGWGEPQSSGFISEYQGPHLSSLVNNVDINYICCDILYSSVDLSVFVCAHAWVCMCALGLSVLMCGYTCVNGQVHM